MKALFPSVEQTYLEPAYFVNSNAPEVIDYTLQVTRGIHDPIEKAVELFYAVRDDFRYNIHDVNIEAEELKASTLVKRGYGYCVEKANLLAATCRVVGVPSRLGFANVKTSIAPESLRRVLHTDVMVFQGYTEIWIEDHWVRVNPAFNASLCQKLAIPALEFGILEQKHFQTVKDYGCFHDLPYDLYVQELRNYYPHLFDLVEENDDQFMDFLNNFPV